jgi:hypothetical protein
MKTTLLCECGHPREDHEITDPRLIDVALCMKCDCKQYTTMMPLVVLLGDEVRLQWIRPDGSVESEQVLRRPGRGSAR